MKKIPIILILFPIMNIFAQPFQIGHISAAFKDKERHNRKVKVEIYYPATQNGKNMPLASADSSRFPVIGFGHGFLIPVDTYKNIVDATVPNGYIIVFPKKERGLAPSHIQLAKDIAFAMASIYELGNDPNSVFFNRIDVLNCIMGHSMGGGCAFVAAGMNPFIKSIVTFAPFETRNSAIKAAEKITIPALIFAGSDDCVTPPDQNQIPIYNVLAGSNRTLITIKGGNHCQMANENFLCNFGEKTCNRHPKMSRDNQHAIINRYLLPWLNYYLKGDYNSGAFFESKMINDEDIEYLHTGLNQK